MISYPFIYLIKTPYGHYFFDVNTDYIYKVEKNIYVALKHLKDGEENLLNEIELKTINEMRHAGLLKTNRPKTMKHPATDFIEYYLNNKIEGITLQVTQDCNFHCSYCPYSQISPNQRKHSKKRMTYENAKKGIDFLRNRTRHTEQVAIGFYGGEPLLEFELIKKIVTYSKNVFFGKPLWFTLTTNCSLLDDKILDFFEQNDVHIIISLDGPKEVHDNNRKFAANGCGTFDVIMKKLEFIEKKHPMYLQNNISFNVVMDPSKEFDCINQMFMNYDVFKKSLYVSSTAIDDRFLDVKNSFSDVYIEQSGYDSFIIFASHVGWVNENDLSSVSKQRATNFEYFRKSLGKQIITEEMSHGGPCITGARKLFMDVDGRFFPCERVSESSPVMMIGNVDVGFDLNKINSLLNICQLMEIKCKNCWAINHCTICAGMIDNGEALSVEKNLKICKTVKLDFENMLKEYIAINEIKAGGCL